MISCMQESTMQESVDMFVSESDSESNVDESLPDLSMIESVHMSLVILEVHNESSLLDAVPKETLSHDDDDDWCFTATFVHTVG